MINFPGPEKILMLAVIALVVLGPTRLPGAARTVGKWVAELRKLTARFQEEMSGALAEPKDALTSAVGDLSKEVGGWRSQVAGVRSSLTTAVMAGTEPEPPEPAHPTLTGHAPSSPPDNFVSSASGLVRPGPPVLPPAPDDPSLN